MAQKAAAATVKVPIQLYGLRKLKVLLVLLLGRAKKLLV